MFITEHEFELPKGYVDPSGTLHRKGVMRLATAADELLPLKDPRVRDFSPYLIVLLLSRVVMRLGTLSEVHPGVIEGLFTEDLAYLQHTYNRINGMAADEDTQCPQCGHHFHPVHAPGGFAATP
ncbi:hypothetical protein LZ017_04790 [Pelomonas sp. CA6]|uniref:hypothetical protein n=1 Tax=Pelomonas sp. CA6 TaxID=2907999 RepID=UPI001F4B3B55|nr:hypothetical protein [Pelomonas sp. CA6]MCH7342694.1 hypothetical protein [Pelomonas sp. CA6]